MSTRYQVFDLVDRLAAKSLIAIDEYGDDTRYRLLETIRHYALDRLAEAGEIAAARDAHAEHWATWAESHNVYLDNSKHIQDALLSNLANLTAAAQWACAGRPDLIRPLILSTGYLIRLDDAESGGQDLFELALTSLDGIDDIAWAYVAMAASVAMGFTWLTPADEAVRRRAEYLAEVHDLRLVQAMLQADRRAPHRHRSRRAGAGERVVRGGWEPELERHGSDVRRQVLLLGRPARRG